MAYLLDLGEIAVMPYLRDLDLSREGRIVLYNMLDELRLLGDHYLNDPTRRLSADSDCFRVDLLFRDPVRRMFHNLQLTISDASAQYGILRVVYVEDDSGPIV